MKFNIIRNIAMAAVATTGIALGSCVGDLDIQPKDPSKLTDLKSGLEYYEAFADLYASLSVAGINGGSDISVDDGGAGVYTRQLWNLQELCTDEAFIGKNWNDAGLDELDYATWSADNHWLLEAMSRFTFSINLCNEFIRTIDKAATVQNPISADEIAQMKREARVLRALSYYYMMDCFGRGPWTTEDSKIGATPPTMTRAEMFPMVVADLKDAIDGGIPVASKQVYGRVSREGALMLLAKLYINAKVYTGTPMFDKCAEACAEIVKTIPNLLGEDFKKGGDNKYKYLFCATNDRYARGGEILWAIPQDNSYTQTYGGTTYLSMGAYNANISSSLQKRLGIDGTGWGGPRVRPELGVTLSPADGRYLLWDGNGQLTNDLANIGDWNLPGGSGLMCIKYVYTPEENYYNADGTVKTNTFNSADFPLFRLADTFLMLAECELNGVKGINGKSYFDRVRARAGLTPTELTADNLLDERMRELYWEGHRRSDLIRFGRFTTKNWSWKGGILAGVGSIPETRCLYAIPSSMTSTLGQNPGY